MGPGRPVKSLKWIFLRSLNFWKKIVMKSLNWICYIRRYRKEVSTHKSVLPSKIKDLGRYIKTETWHFSSELMLLIGAHSIGLFADEIYHHMILPQNSLTQRTVWCPHKQETAAQGFRVHWQLQANTKSILYWQKNYWFWNCWWQKGLILAMLQQF